MEISIIVPTKDRAEIFQKTLASAVEAVRHLKSEIIVVNDSDTTTPQIPSAFTQVKLLRNPGKGVAAARNFGVRQSTYPLILFLDNDILITEESVNYFIQLHKERPGACFNPDWSYPPELEGTLDRTSFGRFLKDHDMITYRGWYNSPAWKENSLFPVDALAGFHLSIMREDFLRTGGYDERFPFAGFEDYDFPLRLRKNEIAQFIDSRIQVYHNETDRLNLENWLSNWERRSASRRVAVQLGYQDLALKYGLFKRLALSILLLLSPLLMYLLKLWSNQRIFYRAFTKLVKISQAARIYKGYSTTALT